MTYASDARIKSLLKSIGSIGNLHLRIFDESHDDQKPWHEGGLTFGEYGSNDAAWYIDEKWIDPIDKTVADKRPVVVVEGSYGTEYGNIGSAQYARFSHALSATMRGLIGIYLIPRVSEYHRTNGSVSVSYWRYDMVYGCLGASEKHSGEYIMMDPYHIEKLKKLLELISEGSPKVDTFLKKVKNEMRLYADTKFKEKYGKIDFDKVFSDPHRQYLYGKPRVGKILKHNILAFTNSRYRNGHIILGEALINRYWFKREVDLILPRFTHEDVKHLDKTSGKEWHVIRKRKDINIITFDDLIFEDDKLEKRLINIRNVSPLKGSALKEMNAIIREMKKQFQDGLLQIQSNNMIYNHNRKKSKQTNLSNFG